MIATAAIQRAMNRSSRAVKLRSAMCPSRRPLCRNDTTDGRGKNEQTVDNCRLVLSYRWMIVGILAFCVFLATFSRPSKIERYCADDDQGKEIALAGLFIRYVGRPTQPNQQRATFLRGPVQRFPSTSDAPLAVFSSSSGPIGGGRLDHLPPMGTAPAGFCPGLARG
jgi:hypothetical protein